MRQLLFLYQLLHPLEFTSSLCAPRASPLIHTGFDPRLVKEIYTGGKTTVDALKDSGFSVRELRAGGFSAAEFKGSFSVKVLNAAGYKLDDLLTAGFDPRLVDAISGPSVSELRVNGFQASELKEAGYNAEELREGGFAADVLKASGFSTAELRQARFTPSILKAAGSSLAELKAAHFLVEEVNWRSDRSPTASVASRARSMLRFCPLLFFVRNVLP